MNEMLKRAVAAAESLPEDAQETIASLILAEVERERGWEDRFHATQDQLGELVRRARAEVAEGDVFPFDPANRPGR